MPTTSASQATGVAAGGERSPPHNGSDDMRVVGTLRLIFKPEVLHRVGLSFPTIWKMMRQGRFAHARIIGGKSAWIESEINNFLAGLPLRRYKSDLSPDAEGDKKAPTHDPEQKVIPTQCQPQQPAIC
jgi:predicted DNA-binding transcriptional regulator AlpA